MKRYRVRRIEIAGRVSYSVERRHKSNRGEIQWLEESSYYDKGMAIKCYRRKLWGVHEVDHSIIRHWFSAPYYVVVFLVVMLDSFLVSEIVVSLT